MVLYNILFLVKKDTYIKKMSRVRFHGIEEISKLSNLKVWGPGWDGYNEKITVQDNIDQISINFDVVICYKPLDLKNFKDVKITKCIRYNEMYDFNWTKREIEESNPDIVICHHENDMKTYQSYYQNYHGQKNRKVKFYHNPHCAKDAVFKDYKLPKKYDILIGGATNAKNSIGGQHYPLRDRFISLLPKIPKKYKIHIHVHPGYTHNDSYTDKYLIDFAKVINQTKLCLTCSGAPKSRFGKYIEIPKCNTGIMGDIPDQDQEDFRKFVIEVNLEMTDDEIINKIIYYLENNDELEEKKKAGLEWASNYGQDNYARRFIQCLDDYFKKPEKKIKKIFIQGEESKITWIIDTFVKEYKQFNADLIVNDPEEADIIWLVADYRYNKIDKKLLKEKYVVTTIHHIDPLKFNPNRIETMNEFTNIYHTISQDGYNSLRKLTDKKIKVFPFWVNQNNWFNISQKKLLRQKFNLNNDFLIGSFQRDTEGDSIKTGDYKPKLSKGPDILVKVVNEYRKMDENVSVVLAGWRRQYVIQELKKLGINYYYFENITTKELNELYNCLDLYVISSRVEGAPRAVVECAMNKTPIIATDVGIVSNILPSSSIYKNEKDCLLAKPNIEIANHNVQHLKVPECFKIYNQDILNLK